MKIGKKSQATANLLIHFRGAVFQSEQPTKPSNQRRPHEHEANSSESFHFHKFFILTRAAKLIMMFFFASLSHFRGGGSLHHSKLNHNGAATEMSNMLVFLSRSGAARTWLKNRAKTVVKCAAKEKSCFTSLMQPP